jgi:prepilin-type N-terminal cleavage/methylation domain-containing protein
VFVTNYDASFRKPGILSILAYVVSTVEDDTTMPFQRCLSVFAARPKTPFLSRNAFQEGFTLSELLISLSVLALISALCLPGIFVEVQEIKRKAVLKESLSMLSRLIVAESQKDEPAQNSQELFTNNGNIVECRWDLPVINPNGSGDDDNGCRLMTGAWVLDVNGHAQFDSVQLDWNGMEAPNELGKDRIAIAMNWGEEPYTDTTYLMGNDSVRSGEIKPSTDHRDWYNELLK